MFEVDSKKLAGEIAQLLEQTDYHNQGWVTTREVADESGESVSTTAARLERLFDLGKIERLKDGKNRLWWRRIPAGKDDYGNHEGV